jgi:hypothetical protein
MRYKGGTLTQVWFVALPALAMLTCSCGGNPKKVDVNSAGASGSKATLILKRHARLTSGVRSFDVLLNDVKVDTVSNGQKLTVTFVPKPGKQSLQVIQPHKFGDISGALESKTVLFEARPGNTYRFECYAETVTGKDIEKAINTHLRIVLAQES